MTSESGIFVIIYLLTLLLVATEMVPMSVAALIGALLTIWFGLSYNIFSYNDMASLIDLKVIGLLLGTMIVLEVTYRSGIFHLIALYTIKLSRGDPRLLFAITSFTAAGVSMLLSDSTALLMMAAAVITISRVMEYDPTPYFISAAIMINLGGTSTLIGSVSNMIIGVESGLGFTEFIKYLTPCEFALWVLTLLTLYFLYRPRLGEKKPVPEFNPWENVRDMRFFTYSALLLVIFIGLFLIHESLNIGPEVIALGCAVLALAVSGIDPSEVFRSLDWETIFFLSGFFFIVGGLEETGLLLQLSQGIFNIAGGNILLAVVLTLWLSGLVSAIVSNIAVALTFVPVIKGVHSFNPVALWSALVLGTNLGGAATPMSGIVCVMALNALKREGVDVSFADFTKVGGLTTLVQLGFSTLYVILRFGLVG